MTEVFHGLEPLVMGTRLEIIVPDADPGVVGPLWERLRAETVELSRRLTRFEPGSEVSLLNAAPGGELEVSETLFAIISEAFEYRRRTCGLFDVALGGVLELVPGGRVRIGERTRPDLPRIDFGGFAKGLVLSRFRKELEAAGVRDAFVNFGGSTLLAMGSQPGGDCWRISAPDPFSGETVAVFDLRDETLSTSGNTPGYSGHIFSPLTGEACRERRMVCVVSPDPLDAEVLSTSLMMADGEQREMIRKEFPDARFETYNL